jgi:hypothetical protein
MPINQYGWAPAPAPLPVVDPSSVPIRSEQASLGFWNQWMRRVRRLRAPLLVLLLAWFAVGFEDAGLECDAGARHIVLRTFARGKDTTRLRVRTLIDSPC